MPTQLDVERLSFTFGDTWTFAAKWDDERAFLSGIERLKGELDGRDESTKAVDLVAVQNGALVLIEAKDFRPVNNVSGGIVPNSLAYAGRWKSLPLEIALKVRDTLAGLVGCASSGAPPHIAVAVRDTLTKPIRVLAFIAQSARQNEPEQKRKVRAKEMRDSLRAKLNWATRDVGLVDPLSEPDRLNDVTVVNRQK